MTNQKRINGGDLLIKCLLQEGIRYLFGIPGGQLLNMYDAIYRWGRSRGIETVMFRHEQAAAHAADAFARVTNKPAVCFGTVGPGATHLLPGIAAAWSDNIPVIAIVPQVLSRLEDAFTLQGNLDQISMFKPVTKYQKSVRNIEQLPDAVRKTFRQAVGGRPGPAILEIYEDVLIAEIEEESIQVIPSNHYRALLKPAIEHQLIMKSIEMLTQAERPIIVAGGGVLRAEGWKELQDLAEHLQIPVITSLMGIGSISNQSRCFIGTTIAGGAMTAAIDADVILSLGCRFTYTMGYGIEPFWRNSQRMIQVDIDPGMIGRNKPITLGVVGDCRCFLEQMLQEVERTPRRDEREWLKTLLSMREEHYASIKKETSQNDIPISSRRLVKEIYTFMDEDACLILDGGEIEAYSLEQIDLYQPRHPLATLIPVGMGHLGTTIPYGIGAKLANPDRQVISITGDGAFMFNIQDLETAARLKLRQLVYVIANNSAWGSMKSIQKLSKEQRFIDVEFEPFDFARCAEAFGCYGESVTYPDELQSALKRAMDSNKPAVIDVKIKYETAAITELLISTSL